MPEPRLASDVPSLLATGLDHPEAVCWAPAEGVILAGGEAGQLYSVDLDGNIDLALTITDGNLLGIALDGDGAVYVCDSAAGQVMRVDGWGGARPGGASVTPYGPAMTYPNYPAFDAERTLWVSDSGHWGSEDGRLIGLAPGGAEIVREIGPFSFANGVAILAREAFLVASGDPAVWRIDLDSGESEPLVRLPRTVPDGVALDAEGGLWISCFQPNRIMRLDPDGELEIVLDDWSGEDFLSPTNLAFAGAGLSTLVMASLCGHTLKRFDPGVAGRPLEYPTVGL